MQLLAQETQAGGLPKPGEAGGERYSVPARACFSPPLPSPPVRACLCCVVCFYFGRLYVV